MFKSQYPELFNKAISKDEKIKNFIQTATDEVFNNIKDEITYSANHTAKLINIDNHSNYLISKKDNITSIYYDDSFGGEKPFFYFINHDRHDTPPYLRIASFTNDTKEFTFTENPKTIKEYVDFINKKIKIPTQFNNETFANHTDEINKKTQIEAPRIQTDITHAINKTKKHQFTRNNRFNVMDDEYTIWNEDNKLFIEDQNIIFIICKDKKNLNVYFYIKDDETTTEQELLKKINNKTTDLINDVALEIKNNLITYCNPIYYDCFLIDLEFSKNQLKLNTTNPTKNKRKP